MSSVSCCGLMLKVWPELSRALAFKDVPMDTLYYTPMDRLIHYGPSHTQTAVLALGQLCVQRHHSGQWAIAADWQARKMSPLFRLYKWRLATITHDWTLHFKARALPASLKLLYHLLYLLPVVFVVGAQRINTGEMPLQSKILANFFRAVLMGSGRQPVSDVIKL